MQSEQTVGDIDRLIGARLSAIRIEANVDQKELADALGMPLADYLAKEQGASRITAAELFELSQFLRSSVVDFFRDVPATTSRLLVRNIVDDRCNTND